VPEPRKNPLQTLLATGGGQAGLFRDISDS
jgi:hypothetical protein